MASNWQGEPRDRLGRAPLVFAGAGARFRTFEARSGPSGDRWALPGDVFALSGAARGRRRSRRSRSLPEGAFPHLDGRVPLREWGDAHLDGGGRSQEGGAPIKIGESPFKMGASPAWKGTAAIEMGRRPSTWGGTPSTWGWSPSREGGPPSGRGAAHLNRDGPHLKPGGPHLEGAEPHLQGGVPEQLRRFSQSVLDRWRTLTRQPCAA
jgi:hypothetical protein